MRCGLSSVVQLRLGETDGGRRSREARPGDHRGGHGPGHPQVALALITLGAVQLEQGEPAADASIEHALAIKHIQDAVPRFIHSPSALQFYSLNPFHLGVGGAAAGSPSRLPLPVTIAPQVWRCR